MLRRIRLRGREGAYPSSQRRVPRRDPRASSQSTTASSSTLTVFSIARSRSSSRHIARLVARLYASRAPQIAASLGRGSTWPTFPTDQFSPHRSSNVYKLRFPSPRWLLSLTAVSMATSQKYMTVWYTNDAAPVLDTLNEPEFQCNHPPGTHPAVAGGRDAYGYWLSTDTAHYMPGFAPSWRWPSRTLGLEILRHYPGGGRVRSKLRAQGRPMTEYTT